MSLFNRPKRVPAAGALFYCLACLATPAGVQATSTSCRADHTDATARVRYVHDGDTFWLEDGRKIRLLGINTPELARDKRPAEPLARQARDDLRRLLGKSARVHLRFGKEKTDRYGRLLAHAFLDDGRNLSEWLLQRGLGYALAIPPNLWQVDCYRQAEQQARRQHKGLWQPNRSSLLQADKLPTDSRGFHVIRGTVRHIGHSRHSLWLDFNRRFAVRISRRDLAWFAGLDIEKLTGKQLEVRGWLQYYKHQLQMRIRHPAAMRILP